MYVEQHTIFVVLQMHAALLLVYAAQISRTHGSGELEDGEGLRWRG